MIIPSPRLLITTTLASVCIALTASAAFSQASTPAPIVLDYEVVPRANFTKAAFRFWSPAYDEPTRAVLLLLPGYNDDGRKNLKDPLWQDFARRNRLALVACFFQGDYADAPSGSGDALQEALAGFARQSSHPEVASAPLLLYGASAGGQFNYNFVIWKPARVMAFIVNKGGFYNDQPPDPQAYATPGLFFLGLKDQPFRVEAITKIWTDGRQKGALWALAPQPESGHEFSRTPDLSRIFFQSVLNARMSGDSIAIRAMEERVGWIGDLSTHEIHPTYPDSLPNLRAAWLPDQTFADAWKEFVVSGVPLAPTAAKPAAASIPPPQQTAPSVTNQVAPAKPLAFEAAVIRPTGTTNGSWRLQPTPDGYTGMDISLFKLVQEAYGVFDAKLISGGPAWIDRDKFDLEAKFDAADVPDAKKLTYRQRADMLQPLLADRFHLKVHHETKDFPVYNLVIAKGGPELKDSPPEHLTEKGVGGGTCLISRTGYEGCEVGSLLITLRYASGRIVVNKTGLTGHYDFSLHWTPDNTPVDSPNANGPSIFTAVQEQLGLKLEPATAPIDTLVIDSAEHPSEN
jgi:uncharacterized protein (TIGR03435 family)